MTTLPPKRFSALISELEAIASDELADFLQPARRGDEIPDLALQQAVFYIRSELTAFGLLNYAHLRDSRDTFDSLEIEHQAKRFLLWVELQRQGRDLA
jgi:hypothetical protein